MSVASKKQKSARFEYEQRLINRYSLQCKSQCIHKLRAPSSSARCLLCACLNMRNNKFDHPSHSVTFSSPSTSVTRPGPTPVLRLAQRHSACAEALRKTQAGEDLSAQETKFMTGHSSQTPCSIPVRTRSLVRLFEHAHL